MLMPFKNISNAVLLSSVLAVGSCPTVSSAPCETDPHKTCEQPDYGDGGDGGGGGGPAA